MNTDSDSLFFFDYIRGHAFLHLLQFMHFASSIIGYLNPFCIFTEIAPVLHTSRHSMHPVHAESFFIGCFVNELLLMKYSYVLPIYCICSRSNSGRLGIVGVSDLSIPNKSNTVAILGLSILHVRVISFFPKITPSENP